jgi:chemotaxis signal transduction protein
MQSVDEDENTRIVVVEIAGIEVGIVVDGVREVFDIDKVLGGSHEASAFHSPDCN